MRNLDPKNAESGQNYTISAELFGVNFVGRTKCRISAELFWGGGHSAEKVRNLDPTNAESGQKSRISAEFFWGGGGKVQKKCRIPKGGGWGAGKTL